MLVELVQSTHHSRWPPRYVDLPPPLGDDPLDSLILKYLVPGHGNLRVVRRGHCLDGRTNVFEEFQHEAASSTYGRPRTSPMPGSGCARRSKAAKVAGSAAASHGTPSEMGTESSRLTNKRFQCLSGHFSSPVQLVHIVSFLDSDTHIEHSLPLLHQAVRKASKL